MVEKLIHTHLIRTAKLLLTLTIILFTGIRPIAVRANFAWPPPAPAQFNLTVRETAGVARENEVVRSGVPVPRSLNITTTNRLALVDAQGTPIPAEFEILARWNAGRKNSAAPIQWLLVTFPATVAANQTATYRIVTDGSVNPATVPIPVTLTQKGDQITVNTGAATFVFGGKVTALFDEIYLPNGWLILRGGDLMVRVNNTDYHPVAQTVSIEHSSPLTAIVVIKSTFNMPALGGGRLTAFRRYIFSANSSTAIVRQAINWEGNLCGDGVIVCNGAPDGLHIQRIRDTLGVNFGTERFAVTIIGGFSQPTVRDNHSLSGEEVWLRQQLRPNRSAPLTFEMKRSRQSAVSGTQADGAVLALSNGMGALAIALNHMHRYEPQALRLLPDSQMAIDMADDAFWLASRQGVFATMAVSALPSWSTEPTRSTLDQAVWAPLNHPLRAWADPAWFAASNVLDEYPVGTLSGDFAAFDSHYQAVIKATMQNIDERGLSGLMTFGELPRYWADPIRSDELDCGDSDPTPGDTSDDAYWCGSWTDYHNVIASVPRWVTRSGDVNLLDELAFPAALRMLHTQIMQCSPTDTYFYCGQAPAGYGGYRSDFNSSHAYFDNLFLYYWLTGDATVVDTLQRGAKSMREFLCNKRPAASCSPDDPPADEWAQLTGRVASQWLAAFRFVGLASDDASDLDDYKSGLARAVTQYYVEAKQDGTSYGFWLAAPVGAAGRYTSDQLWMVSLYDMNLLYRLQQDTEDAPIGNPPVAPSRVIAAWARTLVHFGATVSGNGTPSGDWPNQLDVTWSGSRIGGTLTGVAATSGGDDPLLYDSGKATLTAVIVRAGLQTNDSALIAMGKALTQYALTAAQNEFMPLGKIQGEYLSRLPSAVALLNAEN